MKPLETERLILRGYREADLPEYHRMMSDAENMYYLWDIVTRSLEESHESLRNAIAVNAAGTARRFAMTLKGCDKIIGACGYEIIIPGYKINETDCKLNKTDCGIIKTGYEVTAMGGKTADPMGWFIMPEYQNKGYMTEAVKRVLAFAFLEDNCERVITGCFKENIPTQRVMAKAGFIEEEANPKALFLDGKLRERMKFALTREQYLRMI
ncbi:MAG: GNAT family N-acetyltransferase [Defluviitaleaceae bacterium]|nr:GNAT family N-acetyltransferase [Defluviitaleaceae bacterium]